MAELNIYLFGAPRIEREDKAVILDRNKALALLAYLAVEGGGHRRETLAALFWPEYDHEKSFAYLRRTLWALNDALGEGWVVADREQIELRRRGGLRLDVWQFHSLLAESGGHGHPASDFCPKCIAPLEQAVTLYRGDFLAGFSLRDSAGFDEWQFFKSDQLKGELASGLQRLAKAYLAEDAENEAIVTARRWLALDLLNEDAHRLLMVIYSKAGQRNAALRQYLDCQRVLQAELGVEPEAETTRLYETIKAEGRSRQTGLRGIQENKRQAETHQRTNLPTPATPFVGRDKELDELIALLENPECRLLTLLGPGGIGKTRLSIQAAARIAETGNPAFSDGVYFVPLAPVDSPEFLASALASGLNLQFRSEQLRRDTPESQKVQVSEYLRNRKMLIVLDNFEQLISGAGFLTEILSASPGLKLLVTSRERLRLAEEWGYEIKGMAFPKDENLESLETFGAVQLFVQNARRGRADFEPTRADYTWILRICRMVEGAPLALELAAAWIKMLSCSEIAAEIERNMDFLTSALQGTPERHHSLRAVFENSWNLLTVQERDTLMRLSVFRSPFRREAAAAVGLGGPNSSAAFLLRLSALVDKSLLRRVGAEGQEARFEMHELIRQYTGEKLYLERREAEEALARYMRYYAGWIERMGKELHSPRQIQALSLFEEEIEDVRTAWRLSIEQDQFSFVVQAIDGLFTFYDIRSRFSDAEEDFEMGVAAIERWRGAVMTLKGDAGLVEAAAAYLLGYYSLALFNRGHFELGNQYSLQALELTAGLNRADQAWLYMLLSFGNGRLPNPEEERLYEMCQEYFRQSGNRWAVAMTLLAQINYAQFTLADMNLARQLGRDCLALFSQLGDRVGMVLCLDSQATLLYALGEFGEVKRVSEEIIRLCQILGDQWRVASGMLLLGQACVALGEYRQAESVYQESLELVRELGNRRVEARYLACLGYVNYLENAYEPARDLFEEAFNLSWQIGDIREMGMANMNLGNIALASSNLTEARRRYQLAIDQLKPIPFARWEYSIVLKRIAGLCFEQGELSPAWEYYRQALDISMQLKRTPEVLDNLVGIAELLRQEGRDELTVELLALALALAQEELAQDVRRRAERLLRELKEELQPAQFGHAYTLGGSDSIEQAAARVIELTNR